MAEAIELNFPAGKTPSEKINTIVEETVREEVINKLIKHLPDYQPGNPLDEKSPPKIPNVKSIRTSEWKLILNEYDDTKELYNISKDPFEKDNLIGKKPDVESKLWTEFLKIERKSLI